MFLKYLTGQADKKVGNVHDIRRVARGIVVHLVRLARLILHNV